MIKILFYLYLIFIKSLNEIKKNCLSLFKSTSAKYILKKINFLNRTEFESNRIKDELISISTCNNNFLKV